MSDGWLIAFNAGEFVRGFGGIRPWNEKLQNIE